MNAPSAPAPTAGRRARSPRGQGEQLREEILAASERILIESNDEAALSIRAVASAVGVTPPSIYLHFADRNDLIFAVCERHAESLERAMDEAVEGVDEPWERLRQRGWAYLRWGLDNPEHYRLLMMCRPDRTPERFVDYRLRDTTGLDRVSEDVSRVFGESQPTEAVLQTSELLWMMIHGVVSMLISKPAFPFGAPEAVYNRLFHLVRRGLAGDPSRPSNR
jgi:AcrR family transcriptional regulator